VSPSTGSRPSESRSSTPHHPSSDGGPVRRFIEDRFNAELVCAHHLIPVAQETSDVHGSSRTSDLVETWRHWLALGNPAALLVRRCLYLYGLYGR
jgi:hypothetical protein